MPPPLPSSAVCRVMSSNDDACSWVSNTASNIAVDSHVYVTAQTIKPKYISFSILANAECLWSGRSKFLWHSGSTNFARLSSGARLIQSNKYFLPSVGKYKMKIPDCQCLDATVCVLEIQCKLIMRKIQQTPPHNAIVKHLNTENGTEKKKKEIGENTCHFSHT